MENTKWVLDPAHSEITFKVKHMMIAHVTGHFDNFNAEVESENDQFDQAKIHFNAQIASINTNNAQRDQHLVSPDFFDAEQFPQISFEAEHFNAQDGQVNGQLTIKDKTLPVTFDVDFGGIVKDPWGNNKAGFSLSGKIKRTDFNLGWNAALETGGVLVSEDVRINCDVQFTQAQ